MADYENLEIGMKALIPSPSEGEWRYLFLRRAKNGLLDIPGGRMDTNKEGGELEEPNEALAREVREETGLNIVGEGDDAPRPIALYKINRQPEKLNVIRITNLAKVAIGPALPSHEHMNYLWLTRSEALEQGVDDSLRALLSDERKFAFEKTVSPANLSLSEISLLMSPHEHREAA